MGGPVITNRAQWLYCRVFCAVSMLWDILAIDVKSVMLVCRRWLTVVQLGHSQHSCWWSAKPDRLTASLAGPFPVLQDYNTLLSADVFLTKMEHEKAMGAMEWFLCHYNWLHEDAVRRDSWSWKILEPNFCLVLLLRRFCRGNDKCFSQLHGWITNANYRPQSNWELVLGKRTHAATQISFPIGCLEKKKPAWQGVFMIYFIHWDCVRRGMQQSSSKFFTSSSDHDLRETLDLFDEINVRRIISFPYKTIRGKTRAYKMKT